VSGEELKAWRLEHKAAMEDVAAELGVHRSTISRLERNATIPRLHHLALAVVAERWGKPLPRLPA